jgi:hypothetical protein
MAVAVVKESANFIDYLRCFPFSKCSLYRHIIIEDLCLLTGIVDSCFWFKNFLYITLCTKASWQMSLVLSKF